jgi:hypothetical protein
MSRLTGSCRCGRGRIAVGDEPRRIGICHCTNCRQETGSSFDFFAIWPTDQFETKGGTGGHSGYRFCPECGSRVFSPAAGEVSIKLGLLTDAPTDLMPQFEIWTKRRKSWLRAVDGAEQFEEHRKPYGAFTFGAFRGNTEQP